MAESEGTFRITYKARVLDKNTWVYSTHAISLDFGYVTNIRPTMTKAVSTIPLVSMGADRAFQLETGNTMEYNISFSRVNPTSWDDESEDSTQWSNSKWYAEVTKLADRWQMKTDGCRITYIPKITNPYIPYIDANGYIKMLTRKYDNKFNELITGTIQFVVGTMYVLSSPSKQTIEQKKYRLVLLEPTTDTSGDFFNSLKRYGVKRTFLVMGEGVNTLIMPAMPPAWAAFAGEMKYKLWGWKITDSPSREKEVNKSLDISDYSSDRLTLYAVWVSGS